MTEVLPASAFHHLAHTLNDEYPILLGPSHRWVSNVAAAAALAGGHGNPPPIVPGLALLQSCVSVWLFASNILDLK